MTNFLVGQAANSALMRSSRETGLSVNSPGRDPLRVELTENLFRHNAEAHEVHEWDTRHLGLDGFVGGPPASGKRWKRIDGGLTAPVVKGDFGRGRLAATDRPTPGMRMQR